MSPPACNSHTMVISMFCDELSRIFVLAGLPGNNTYVTFPGIEVSIKRVGVSSLRNGRGGQLRYVDLTNKSL